MGGGWETAELRRVKVESKASISTARGAKSWWAGGGWKGLMELSGVLQRMSYGD